MRIHLALRGGLPSFCAVLRRDPIDNISHLSMVATAVVFGLMTLGIVEGNRAPARRPWDKSKVLTLLAAPVTDRRCNFSSLFDRAIGCLRFLMYKTKVLINETGGIR